MKTRYKMVLMLILGFVCASVSAYAIEIQVGSEIYTVEVDVDLENATEIETQSFDVESVIQRLDEDSREQITRDLLSVMLMVDAIQHNDYSDSSEWQFEDLLYVIPFIIRRTIT